MVTQHLTLPTIATAGSIDAYIQAARQFPMLSEEEEFGLATRFRKEDDLDAARQRVHDGEIPATVAVDEVWRRYLECRS